LHTKELYVAQSIGWAVERAEYHINNFFELEKKDHPHILKDVAHYIEILVSGKNS
jgi:hypothetical protein